MRRPRPCRLPLPLAGGSTVSATPSVIPIPRAADPDPGLQAAEIREEHRREGFETVRAFRGRTIKLLCDCWPSITAWCVLSWQANADGIFESTSARQRELVHGYGT
jgi:hypothetical protein